MLRKVLCKGPCKELCKSKWIIGLVCLGLSIYAEASRPNVLTTIKPLALLVDDIAGDTVTVDVLLPTNVSPHHYSLSISDRRNIEQADLLLWVGFSLESFMAKPLKMRSAPTISAIEVLHKEVAARDQDPHVWLNPINYSVLADEVTTQLSQLQPQHKALYRANSQRLKQALVQQHQQLKAAFMPLAGRPFVVAHPAYDHFTKSYGLGPQHYINYTPEHKSSAKHLFKLRQLKGVTCVLKEEGFEDKHARQLAQEINVPVETLDLFAYRIDRTTTNKRLPNATQQFIEGLAGSFQRCLRSPAS